MTLKHDLRLLLSLPSHHLPVVPRCQEVISVYAIDIQYLAVMLIKGLNQPSLRKIPLLQSQVRTDRTEVVRLNAKLNAIYCVFMSFKCINQSQATGIPKLNQTVIPSSG